MPGRPAWSAATSAPCSIRPARLVLTSSAVGFMRARSAAVTMPRVASTRRMWSEMHVALGEERGLARRDGVAVAAGALARARSVPTPTRPCRTPCRSRRRRCRSGRSRRCRASCRAACDRRRSATSRLQRGHLLRDLPHGGQDECPRQLGGGVRRRSRVHARGDDHAERGAGVDVDVRVDAALADQPQLRQPLKQRRSDLRALADEHERLGVAQPLGEHVDVLDMVGPDRDVVTGEPGEAVERAQRVVIVVEDGDLHGERRRCMRR